MGEVDRLNLLKRCSCGKPLTDCEERILRMAQDRDREITVWKTRLVEEAARLREQHRGAVDRAEVLRRTLEMAVPSADVRARCIERAEREWAEARIDAGGQ